MKNVREYDQRIMSIAISVQGSLDIDLDKIRSDMIDNPYNVVRVDKDILMASIAHTLGYRVLDNGCIETFKGVYRPDNFIMSILTNARRKLKGLDKEIELL